MNVKTKYRTVKGKVPILSISPNSGQRAIHHPDPSMADCKLCIIKDDSAPSGWREEWVRARHIELVPEDGKEGQEAKQAA